MAKFNQFGLSELLGSLENMANIPNGVMDAMLNAGADVLAERQKVVGERMGVHKTGVTLDSIKKSTQNGCNKGWMVYRCLSRRNKCRWEQECRSCICK